MITINAQERSKRVFKYLLITDYTRNKISSFKFVLQNNSNDRSSRLLILLYFLLSLKLSVAIHFYIKLEVDSP